MNYTLNNEHKYWRYETYLQGGSDQTIQMNGNNQPQLSLPPIQRFYCSSLAAVELDYYRMP